MEVQHYVGADMLNTQIKELQWNCLYMQFLLWVLKISDTEMVNLQIFEHCGNTTVT